MTTETAPVSTGTAHIRRAGTGIIVSGLAAFFLWAAFAPLDKGVSLTGVVAVSGHSKTVQAPADGLIERILVADGDRVTAGQPLIRLSPLLSQAQLQALAEQHDTVLLSLRRVTAELNGQAALTTESADHFYTPQARVRDLTAQQNQWLAARRLTLENGIAAQQAAADGLTQRLVHLRRMAQSAGEQLAGLITQTADLKTLAAEGWLPRHRWQESEREQAGARRQYHEQQTQIRQAEAEQQAIFRQIAQMRASAEQDARQELAQLTVQHSELVRQLTTETEQRRRHDITAPADGVIMAQTVFTQGGVVRSGDTLMTVVPDDQPLLIEGRLPPQWADKVAPGLSADLMMTALNQNRTPKIRGEVMMIAADSQTNERTGEAYYPVQLAVEPDEWRHVPVIRPGMPAEILIRTGERSLFSYLFKPVTDRLHSAMTEE